MCDAFLNVLNDGSFKCIVTKRIVVLGLVITIHYNLYYMSTDFIFITLRIWYKFNILML